MLRRVIGFLSRPIMSARARPFSSDLPAAQTTDSAFVGAWKKVTPNIDPPKAPLSFKQPRTATSSSIPSKLTVNFVLPYASELSTQEVDMLIIPATTEQMGVLPGHETTITELKPSVLSVDEGNKVTKYFISNRSVFIRANSRVDVIATEAVPLDQIDASLDRKGLEEFTQKLNSASTDMEKVDVHHARSSTLTG